MKYSQSDWDKLRQELELNFQAQLLAKEREWSSKLADRDTRLATLEDNNKKLRQINEDMRYVGQVESLYSGVSFFTLKRFGQRGHAVREGS